MSEAEAKQRDAELIADIVLALHEQSINGPPEVRPTMRLLKVVVPHVMEWVEAERERRTGFNQLLSSSESASCTVLSIIAQCMAPGHLEAQGKAMGRFAANLPKLLLMQWTQMAVSHGEPSAKVYPETRQ